MSNQTTIPAGVLRKLKEVEHTGNIMTYEGVTIMSPRGPRPYWRVKFYWNGRSFERSGGRTFQSVWCVIEEMGQKLHSLKLQQEGKPEKSFKTVAQMIEDYFANFGPAGDWSVRTLGDRTNDFMHLLVIGKSVPCVGLTQHHLRTFIATASTGARARHLKGVLGTLLRWGASTGYLTDQQAKFVTDVQWAMPKDYVSIPSRRDQAKTHDPLASGVLRGNVPTHAQVSAWATECGTRYIHGEGLIHTDANLGLRSAELRIMTADIRVALKGEGNLVRPDSGEVLVRFQAGRFTGKLPKGSKQRNVVIPPIDMISTGFDVRAFLSTRCTEALKEQINGDNPNALIFPDPDGNVWADYSLRKMVWAPAAVALGWRMNPYVRGDGKTRAMLRFTLHSLRDRFATTAVNEWRYAENQILAQGSWEDAETVRRFYAGITDDTHGDVRKLHGLQDVNIQ